MIEETVQLDTVIDQMITVLSLDGITTETRYEADHVLRIAIAETARHLKDAIENTRSIY